MGQDGQGVMEKTKQRWQKGPGCWAGVRTSWKSPRDAGGESRSLGQDKKESKTWAKGGGWWAANGGGRGGCTQWKDQVEDDAGTESGI